MANINNEEPSTAPHPDRWYDLTLGPSYTDHSKFYTLRYDFKPASIDKSEPGMLQKDSNKRVMVEYNNNQPGKPKLVFEGVSEDYKDNDAVLFFDGRSFRLERLHRAVKRLRHVRLPGDPLAAATVATTTPPPPLAAADKGTKFQGADQHVPVVQMEQHTITEEERNVIPQNPATSSSSPEAKNYEAEEKEMDTTAGGGSEESVDILSVDDEDDGVETAGNRNNSGSGGRVLDIDINVPHQAEMEDENAEVDINDDDDVGEEGKGPNAAEALKAQVGAAEEDGESTSSGTNSGSDSSRSGAGTSSSSSGTDTTSAGDSSSG